MKLQFLEWPILNYSYYRNLAMLAGLDSRYKMLSGDLLGAFRVLASIKAMAEHLRSYPTLISFMMASAIDGIRVDNLEYILAHTPCI